MTTLNKKFTYRRQAKLFVAFIAALIGLASTNAYSIGLGTIRVDSLFGQPFVGSVEVFNPEGYDSQSILVSLASRETHEELGINRALYLDNLSLDLAFRASGTAEILISGKQPLGDPYLEFAIEMRWPEGRIVRDYTVLVGMPSAAAPPLRIETQRENTISVKPAIPHSSLYSVEAGDTLSEIAERLDDRKVSLSSAVKTLSAHNIDLLDARGTLGLRVGDRVRIPAKEIFSQPAAPQQAIAQTQTAENQATTNPRETSNVLATPLAKAETRLRALGYANLQTLTQGETPNPVVASGAAAKILEKLITEQGGNESTYSTAQISRLADGLNEVADISRAYQDRLFALEEATKANAEVLAALVEQRASGIIEANAENAALPKDSFSVAEPTLVAIAPETTSVPSTNLAIDSSASASAKVPSGWFLVFPVLLALFGYLFFWLKRQREDSYAHDSSPSFAGTGQSVQEDTAADSEQTAVASNKVANEESPVDERAPQEILEEVLDDSQNDTEVKTPFYDEDYEEDEAPLGQDEPEDDIAQGLDEELKLISIFEESLATETAVREQIKQEEELITEALPTNNSKEDILDFDLDSLESEETLEFILGDPDSPDVVDDQTSMDELLEWQPEPSGTLNKQCSDEEQSESDSTDEPLAPEPNTSSFAGYGESSSFSQINPVEVVDIVNTKLKAAKNAGQETTLFYIEVDQFNTFEKELGIVKTEKLAAAVASNIYERIENPVILRRFRQNGFVLLLAGGQNQQNLQFGQELVMAIASTPMEVSNETFFTTLSIGIVPVASGFSNSAEIIEKAQQIVVEVQEEQNGNGAKLCELDPDTAFNDASIIRAGRKLLSENSLVTVYQPITALKGDPLEFYEARLKLSETAEPSALPEDLIARLGNTDLSTEIDCLNVTQALKDLKHYLNSHINTRLFVAISARTATDNFFRNWFEKTIFSEGIHPERIVFQMPESSVSRHLNTLIGFRDYTHGLGARICISQLDFQHVPEHALARLHPDFVQLHAHLAGDAQHEGKNETDLEKQRQGLTKLTEVLEKARPLCEKIIVPGVSQARIIPTLWPLSVDYIQGDYIQPESLAMDYEFSQAAL